MLRMTVPRIRVRSLSSSTDRPAWARASVSASPTVTEPPPTDLHKSSFDRIVPGAHSLRLIIRFVSVAVFCSPAEVARRAAGPVTDLCHAVFRAGDDRHVPDFPPDADFLAVEVDLDRWVGRHHVDVAVEDVRVGAAEEVRHDGEGSLRRRAGAERQVEDRAQVLL